MMATSCRPRLASMPAHYFGNTNLITPMRVPGAQLRTASLPELARLVHDTLQRVDERLIADTLAWVCTVPDKSKLQASIDMSTGLAITQWNKQPMYSGACFEPGVGGEPVRVCLPHVPGFDGLVILFATESSTGGALDVLIGLQSEAMERLVEQAEFRRYR